ncbi:MAG: hypothetical protein JRH12_24305 [Deltaproteobacteria bacterium]|nr:hypothetical protein [Deltaproteobacteria bacterium]
MKRYRQNPASYVSSSLVSRFFLYVTVLLGLVAAPFDAVAESAAAANRYSSGLEKDHAGINALSDPGTAGDDPVTLLTPSEYPVKDEHSVGDDGNREDKRATVEPITRALPVWGEKVRAMGYDLPLPFGAGVNLVYMEQGIDVRNLKIGFGSADTKIERVIFSDSHVRDMAATARLDLWLLPFVNIYGILGYIDGEAELDVKLPGISIDVPGFGSIPILDPNTLNLDIDYSGATYGGGITLAGGYKNFFGSVDANYTYTDIDIVNGDIKTLTISPRVGILVDPSVVAGSFALWIGAMYMDYEQKVTDTVNLRELDPRLPSAHLDFAIEIKNEEPWNFLIGGQWEITKRWQMTVEGGVGNRRQFIFGTTFRF